VAILKTGDIRRTEDWYRNAGSVLRAHHPERDPTWCELERDGTVLQFLSGGTRGPKRLCYRMPLRELL
jgi:hypothetical protein